MTLRPRYLIALHLLPFLITEERKAINKYVETKPLKTKGILIVFPAYLIGKYTQPTNLKEVLKNIKYVDIIIQ